MQHFSFVLFQLDEARRYIQDGRSQHLRLAFLLLDNAAEIQMDRRIKEDLVYEDMKERLRNNALLIAQQMPQVQMPESLQEQIAWTPLSRSEKSKLDRFFDEKIAYMVGRGGHLNASLAGPLKHLHKYRNEAYHRAKIRPETIRTATIILLEINCQMLLTVYPGGRMMSSDEEYSWLEERFGHSSFLREEQLKTVVDEIRCGLLPTDESVANTLADHLQERFAQLDEALDFIVENIGRAANKEEALKEIQFHIERQRATGQPPTAGTFVPKYTMGSIQTLSSQLPQVRGAPSRVEAFARFADVEKGLEPIEESVYEVAGQIDEAIQLAIDAARGG
jgi:hypothetical protein